MKNKFLVIGLAALLAVGIWLPGLSYAQTATNNFGITPGMSDAQIVQVLTQVVTQLLQQIQTIMAQRSQSGQATQPASMSQNGNGSEDSGHQATEGEASSQSAANNYNTYSSATSTAVAQATSSILTVSPSITTTSSPACIGSAADVVAGPLGNSGGTGQFEKLGLTTSTEPGILQYRILWFTGQWSPWYVPGVNDVDSLKNIDGSSRRIWSYFDDHTHEYVYCPNKAESGPAPVPTQPPADVTQATSSVPTSPSTSTVASQLTASFTAPAANASLTAGGPISVSFTSSDPSAVYDLTLLGTNYEYDLGKVSQSAGGTQFNFTLPNNITAAGNPYRLGLYDNGAWIAYSSYFNITATQPAITVTAPSGGSYNPGDQLTINWSSNGVTQVSAELVSVSSSGGNNYQIFSNLSPTSGAYNWIIPSTVAAGTYRVLLISPSPYILAYSGQVTVGQN